MWLDCSESMAHFTCRVFVLGCPYCFAKEKIEFKTFK